MCFFIVLLNWFTTIGITNNINSYKNQEELKNWKNNTLKIGIKSKEHLFNTIYLNIFIIILSSLLILPYTNYLFIISLLNTWLISLIQRWIFNNYGFLSK